MFGDSCGSCIQSIRTSCVAIANREDQLSVGQPQLDNENVSKPEREAVSRNAGVASKVVEVNACVQSVATG